MKTLSLSKAKEVVLSFLDALNDEDYESAKKLVTDDMQFKGVLGERDGADAYFADMEKMRLQYDILKVFEDEKDVCVFYNIDMSGKTVFCCGWYHVEEGKIDSIRVIFDPRPVLEGKK